MNEKKDPGYIRLLPLSTNDFPSCECAKIFIENDFRRDGELLPGLLDIFLGDYYSKMFILFQYQGEIIGSLLCMRYIRESHIIIQLFILIWILLMY